jgi:hypothetical protein
VKCRDPRISQVLLGTNRVGLTGLRDALKRVDEAGLTDREAVVDLLVAELAADNYVANRRDELYRTMLWREYLRHKGRDFSEFLSEVPVTIRGEPGGRRDEFVAMVRSVFGGLELKPRLKFQAADPEGPNPQLVINGETIVRGFPHRDRFKAAIVKSTSHW